MEDLSVFRKLALAEGAKGSLTKSESKRFHRARTRLLRAGVLEHVTRQQLEDLARQAYRALPWYKRVRMLIRFHIRRIWFGWKRNAAKGDE